MENEPQGLSSNTPMHLHLVTGSDSGQLSPMAGKLEKHFGNCYEYRGAGLTRDHVPLDFYLKYLYVRVFVLLEDGICMLRDISCS